MTEAQKIEAAMIASPFAVAFVSVAQIEVLEQAIRKDPHALPQQLARLARAGYENIWDPETHLFAIVDEEVA